MAIVGYTSATSYFPEEPVEFHLSTDDANDPNFILEILRIGAETPVRPQVRGTAQARSYPSDASENGCRWPAEDDLTFQIPGDWPSGVYIARFTTDAQATNDIHFVVKSVVSLDSVDEGATKNRWSLADRADRESQEAPDSSTTPP